MKKNIYTGVTLVILFLFTCFTSCEEKNQDNIKVTHLTVKEAKLMSTGKIMQLSFKDNETLQLTLTVIPTDAANKTVKYSNKYPALMSVSPSGLITGIAPGIDTLTIEATDGSDVKVSYHVQIIDHRVKATGITVTEQGRNMLLKVGNPPFDLAACLTVNPADTYNKALTYTSSDESIATVGSNGMVTSVAAGTATITVTTTDGTNISQVCNVTVQELIQQWSDFDRSAWTVTTLTGTGYAYHPDASTGLPEHMFDDNTATYIAFVKPGKALSPTPAQPADFLPSFTVDIKSQKEFNYILWRHRSSNNNQYLRMYGVNVYGSSDGTVFTPITTSGILWIPNISGYVGGAAVLDSNTYRIDIPKSTYRFVRIELAIWSDNYNSQHPDYQGTGSTSGSSVNCAEFGLGYSWWE